VRITRLYLRNYRVYEEPLELEVPAGLVGIYGLNGSGKSTLVESVRWTLFGNARTRNNEIRTSGILGDCVTEVEFEHEGHLYLIRRVIAGQAATVRAQVHCDGSQVAGGVTDTSRYVRSILGMDDASFRASVFAEQNQLSAFSDHAPSERRKLVLGLLGVTTLDGARDQARKDAREKRGDLDRLRAMLADLGQLEQRLASAEAAADHAEGEAAVSGLAEEEAGAAGERAEAAYERLAVVGQQYRELVREGETRRDELDRASRRIQGLRAEEEQMGQARARLASLVDRSAGLADAEEHLRLSRAVVEAWGALVALGALIEVPPPDPEPATVAREMAEGDREWQSELEGERRALEAERDRAAAAWDKASGMSGEGSCPLCGQALGEAFRSVVFRRAADLDLADQRLAALANQIGELEGTAQASGARSRHEEAALRCAQGAWDAYQREVARRSDAQARLDAALAAACTSGLPAVGSAGGGGGVVPSDTWTILVQDLMREVQDGRRAAEECERLRGRLEREASIATDLAEELVRRDQAQEAVEGLREKVRALAFRAEDLQAAQAVRARASQALADARARAQAARVAAAQARTRAEGAASALEEARAQRAKAESLAGEARHLGRAADLLSGFRDTVVATIGPRLSAQAAELFGELTDHEYDRLEVNPETYEIQLGDQGILYGMDRFSGSETDLANLALRVAVSEQVGFQSGGAVGLLVLDEVFGPLDNDRKDRMLGALQRLQGRFRQILVITHDSDIKEQLPSAIEVLKQPGRRATATLV